ncbi:MAG: sensor histidine kinase, partial [Jiangellaceae bacterium]
MTRPGTAGAWSAATFVALLGHLFTNVTQAGARERAAADQRLVDAERLRLAQEVHDVMGHGLAAIQMQADIALHVRKARPEQSGAALEAISRASAEALDELRATLAVITPGRENAAVLRAPTPGLARLDALWQRVEEAGLVVEVTTEGEPRPLPPAGRRCSASTSPAGMSSGFPETTPPTPTRSCRPTVATCTRCAR